MKNGQKYRVILVGAGAAGQIFLREIRKHPDKLPYNPIVFLDDNRSLHNTKIEGLTVAGPISDLESVVAEYEIDLVLITMPSVPGSIIRDIVHLCEEIKIKFKVVPPVYRNLQISGISEPRDISMEDLLHLRPKNILDADSLEKLRNETILVTGAAGSIGSEIAFQIATVSPRRLVALDIDESGLHDMKVDIAQDFPECRIDIVLCDIKDERKLQSVFQEYHPTLIFHTAAYKHVPLLESFPEEAVGTNIGGSLNVLNTAIQNGVQRVIDISTDKAVEPCSVMGMTKKIVEMLCRCKQNEKTELVVVRFGNVLESHGSVIPLFRRQIAKGGPVTITHPDVERFFMTITEAAQLVIRTALVGKPNKKYVLNMGKPIKILDIARDLIHLSDANDEIGIRYIGLRPGEKLTEKLFDKNETQILLDDNLIFEVDTISGLDCSKVLKSIDNLLANYTHLSREELLSLIKRIASVDQE